MNNIAGAYVAGAATFAAFVFFQLCRIVARTGGVFSARAFGVAYAALLSAGCGAVWPLAAILRVVAWNRERKTEERERAELKRLHGEAR